MPAAGAVVKAPFASCMAVLSWLSSSSEGCEIFPYVLKGRYTANGVRLCFPRRTAGRLPLAATMVANDQRVPRLCRPADRWQNKNKTEENPDHHHPYISRLL